MKSVHFCQLQSFLAGRFAARTDRLRAAGGGVWRYFLFVGQKNSGGLNIDPGFGCSCEPQRCSDRPAHGLASPPAHPGLTVKIIPSPNGVVAGMCWIQCDNLTNHLEFRDLRTGGLAAYASAMSVGRKIQGRHDFVAPARRALGCAARKVREGNHRLGLPLIAMMPGKPVAKPI